MLNNVILDSGARVGAEIIGPRGSVWRFPYYDMTRPCTLWRDHGGVLILTLAPMISHVPQAQALLKEMNQHGLSANKAEALACKHGTQKVSEEGVLKYSWNLILLV